jgi:hypothetical protein
MLEPQANQRQARSQQVSNPYDQIQHILNRQVKEVATGYPFLGAGNHVLAVVEFRHFHSVKQGGASVGVDFMVMQSDNPDHTPGSFRTQSFFISRPSKFPGGADDMDRLGGMMCKLEGVGLDQSQRMAGTLLGARGIAEQPARGVLIRARGSAKASKTPGAPPFVEVAWEHVPCPPEQTAQIRAQIDQLAPLRPAAPPAQHAQPAYPNQYQQGGQPHGYAPAQPQPQFAPQQYPAGVPAPAQPAPQAGPASFLAGMFPNQNPNGGQR